MHNDKVMIVVRFARKYETIDMVAVIDKVLRVEQPFSSSHFTLSSCHDIVEQ